MLHPCDTLFENKEWRWISPSGNKIAFFDELCHLKGFPLLAIFPDFWLIRAFDTCHAFTMQCEEAYTCVKRVRTVCSVQSIRSPLDSLVPQLLHKELIMNAITKKKGEKAEAIRLVVPTNQAGTILAIVVNVTEWNQLILHPSGYKVIPRHSTCIHHQKLFWFVILMIIWTYSHANKFYTLLYQ